MKDKEYPKIFSKNLRRIAYTAGKSQADISKDLKINKATVSSWMNGTRVPRMESVDLLCHYFNVKRSDLMEDVADLKESDASPSEKAARYLDENPDAFHLVKTYKGLSDIGKKKVIQYTDGLYSLEHQEQELFAAHHREGVTQVSDHDRAIMEDDSKWEE